MKEQAKIDEESAKVIEDIKTNVDLGQVEINEANPEEITIEKPRNDTDNEDTENKSNSSALNQNNSEKVR